MSIRASGDECSPAWSSPTCPSPRGAQALIQSLQAVYAAPILVLSGRFRRGLAGSAEAARRLGVKKVLPKPFTRKELLSAVAASLEDRSDADSALRYALAPACIVLAALLYLSPAGPVLSLAGLFVFAVLAAAWFGGAGPGLLAAVLATFTLPQLMR